MVLFQVCCRSARCDAVVRITGYEGLLCLSWVTVVGLEGFEPPTHGVGNLFPWNPLHCHQPSSQLRHKDLFRHSSAWAGAGFLPLVSQGTQQADRHAAGSRRTRL